MKKYLEPEFNMDEFAFETNITTSVPDENLGTNDNTGKPTLPIIPAN